MKLSILIFVLTTVICKCQCAPTPDWVEDFQRNMQKMTQEIHESQKQMDKTFKALGQQFQNSQKNFENQMKQINNKLSSNGTNGLEDLNGINTYVVSGQSTISTSQIVNGHRIDKFITENVINNVKYRTEMDYDSATDKTTIKKYECNLFPDFQCNQTSNEVRDGPPRSLY